MNFSRITPVILMAVFALPNSMLAQGPQAANEVTDNEQLKFDQEKVAANMRELEDRMIKLADLLRDAKPDDSARLLLGVENAREQLILEQMSEVSGLLDNVDLARATAEQKQVLEKLGQLKGLLLNVNLDLRIRMEQLKKLATARKRLNELLSKEQKQKEATDAAAKQGNPTQPLQANEERNETASQNLQQQVRKIGGSGKASKSIGGASNSMNQASKSLSQGKGGEASQSQQKAIEQLRKAQEEMGEMKKRLQQQAEAAARQRVNELLMDMLNRQTKVRGSTAGAWAQFKQQKAQMVALLGRLAQVEDQIIAAATECIEICELTEFSMVLPTALGDLRDRMNDVRATLEQGVASERVVAEQDQIISDLQELIAAMKDASKPGSPKNSKKKQKGGADDRNKMLAEVKMVYWLQKAVGRKTKKIRTQELAGQIDAAELDRRTKTMMQQQDKILEVTENLREMSNAGFVNGDDLPAGNGDRRPNEPQEAEADSAALEPTTAPTGNDTP